MSVEPSLYRDLAYVFTAALAGGLLARRLHQPLIIGYVLAGMLIGPFTPGPRLSDLHTLELLAEVGVILLMFSIGIEFSPRELLSVKWVALIGGPAGILLSLGMALGVGKMIGWSLHQSIAIGGAVCVASTMVMSRQLIDRGELDSPHGRVMFSITLVEDFAVIVLTVLLPALGSSGGNPMTAVLFDIGKALIILIPVIFVATKWVPGLMRRVARMNNPELYVLIVLTLGFATAAISQALGLSLALGAFLGGMIISETEVAGEALERVQPLRDAMVALFFVSVGALIDPRALLSSPKLLAILVGMILIGKLAIWTSVVRMFNYPFRTALLAGVGLTQIGEFSYVLIRVAHQQGLVGQDVYNAILAASLLTILLNAAMMRLIPQWLNHRKI